MLDFTLTIEQDDWLREMAAVEMRLALKLAHVLEQVGWETIAYLRSIGHGLRPPARPGEPPRSAHPGQWADITSNLANAYRFELYAGGARIRWTDAGAELRVQGSFTERIDFPLELRLINGMEYAAELEARDGYWVLSGVADPGGPLESALRTVLARLAPDMEVRG